MLRSLEYKSKVFDDKIGEEKINMIIPGIIIPGNVKINYIHDVQENEAMRPDLISLKYYNTPDAWDLILKVNGISNPFAIKPGIKLQIPDYNAAQKFKVNKPKINPEVRKQFTDTKRMNEEDKNRLEFLKKISSSKPNGSKENLPPNMLKSNETTKIYKDGRIILGANLPTNK